MKKTFIKALSLACLLFSFNAHSAEMGAQEAPQTKDFNPSWWVNLGFGIGGSHQSDRNFDDNIGGFTMLASVNDQLAEHRLVTVRYVQTDEYLGCSRIHEVGALYGAISRWEYAYASASAGLGAVQYYKCRGGFLIPDKHEGTYRTIGVPAEIQLMATPTKYLGLGFVLFGDLNSQKSFAGAALAFQVRNLD